MEGNSPSIKIDRFLATLVSRYNQLHNAHAMKRLPETRISLVIRLRDHDAAAWEQFVEIYSGVIFAYCRRCGFQDADANDLVQEVLQSVAGAMPKFEYDPDKGAFRSWLFTICRNKIRSFANRARRAAHGAGGSDMNQRIHAIEDDKTQEEIWNREHELHLFAWAMHQVESEFQQTTWRAFQRVAIDLESPEKVAAELNISKGAVYIAKSRVISRIRDEIEALEG